MNIYARRLANQLLLKQPFMDPADVVHWLGAVQAQEYGFAKWALGMRLPSATDQAIEQALNEGRILRTHLLRPTWHFVAAGDIRWMLTLTAPRINALNAYYYRKYELDDAVFARSNAAIEKALQDGQHLTRPELQEALGAAGIVADGGLRTSYIMMRAELDMLICSGVRRGKHHTYALLEQRVLPNADLTHEAALAELARRYFRSHGPATIKDYVWWSGLTVADAKRGLDILGTALANERIDGLDYWFDPSLREAIVASPIVHLLPPYDELMIAYKDRGEGLDAAQLKQVEGSNGAVMTLDGRIVGTWRREFQSKCIVCTLQPFAELSAVEEQAFVAQAHKYGAFHGMQVEVV